MSCCNLNECQPPDKKKSKTKYEVTEAIFVTLQPEERSFFATSMGTRELVLLAALVAMAEGFVLPLTGLHHCWCPMRPRPRLRGSASAELRQPVPSALPHVYVRQIGARAREASVSPLYGVLRADLPAVAGRGAARSNQLSGCPALKAVGRRPDASVRSKQV